MNDPIEPHPEFGLNPTGVACWFCGQPTGEIALLGKYYDGQAPNRSVLDRKPCERCQEDQRTGVLLLSVSDASTPEHPERTGKLVALKEAVLADLFEETFATQLLLQRWAFLPDALWVALGLPTESTSRAADVG